MTASLYILCSSAFLLYFYFCIKRPSWTLAVLFFVAPLQHDVGLGGLRFSVTEILLLLNAGALLLFRLRLNPGPVWFPAVLYLGICVLSWWTQDRTSAATSILQMMVYLIVAVYVGSWSPLDENDVKQALNGIVTVGILLGLIAIATRSMSFLGLHKNSLGSAFSSAFLAAFILWEQAGERGRQRLFYLVGMLSALAGVLIVASRGAWLGTAVAMLILLIYQRRFKLAMRLAFFGGLVVPALWGLVPENTREFAMNLSADSYNVNARLEMITYAKRLFEQNIWLGSGVGLRKEYDATNLVMSTLAETGIAGLMGLSILIFSVYFSFHRAFRRMRYMPKLWTALTAASFALFTTRLIHGLVDHYWGRGLLVLGWTSVGFAWALHRLAGNHLAIIDSEMLQEQDGDASSAEITEENKLARV